MEDLHALGEDLVTTAARMVRWVPKQGVDVSLSALRILARLKDHGATRISDLAVAERCSQPTITNHIKRLESLHLVSRRSDPHDARACVIVLTPRGHVELARVNAVLGRSVQPYLERLPEADRQALRAGVEATRRLMDLVGPESSAPREGMPAPREVDKLPR